MCRVPGTEAGFLYQRFRAEMVKAMEAWLAASPLTDADAPGTPFEMPEYRVREAERSLELEAQAETFRQRPGGPTRSATATSS